MAAQDDKAGWLTLSLVIEALTTVGHGSVPWTTASSIARAFRASIDLDLAEGRFTWLLDPLIQEYRIDGRQYHYTVFRLAPDAARRDALVSALSGAMSFEYDSTEGTLRVLTYFIEKVLKESEFIDKEASA